MRGRQSGHFTELPVEMRLIAVTGSDGDIDQVGPHRRGQSHKASLETLHPGVSLGGQTDRLLEEAQKATMAVTAGIDNLPNRATGCQRL